MRIRPLIAAALVTVSTTATLAISAAPAGAGTDCVQAANYAYQLWRSTGMGERAAAERASVTYNACVQMT
ncbi:hypothetical protein ACFYY8_23175 [Streptosporangium sp. NPDC001559]|uniref:hypothetical protein n=1 Tax=Streptosporangium sp. NPDC001559 TaxID=3366187 RepID=UPI0036ED7FEC